MTAIEIRKCPVCLVDETTTDDLDFHVSYNHSPQDVRDMAAKVVPHPPVWPNYIDNR